MDACVKLKTLLKGNFKEGAFGDKQSKRQSPDVHLSTSFLSSLERLKEQCGSLKTDPHI